jgi:predicted methyltransferase
MRLLRWRKREGAMRGSPFFLSIILCLTPLAASADAEAPADAIRAAVADPARPAADRARDAERKPGEMLAFAGIKPGDRVLEFLPGSGYYTRLISRIVGPTGNVYAFTPTEILKAFPKAADGSRAIAAEAHYSNVSVLVAPAANMHLPRGLDVVWTTQNYHDLHLAKYFPDLDIRAYNRALLAALKPGGVYLVSDHEAKPGSALRDIELHRIDAEVVRTQVTRAGFAFDGESSALRNPNDPHTANVFDAGIRGRTDQFVFRFRRPVR